MIDGVLLRRAESEDAWPMGVIETACWRVGYAGVLPQPVLEALDETVRADRWQRILRRAGSEAWVAQNLEGRVLGFTALGLPSEEWEDEPDAQDEHRVRSLFVAPPFWRLGLGTRLLKWAEEQTVVLGGQHILARVPRDAAWVRGRHPTPFRTRDIWIRLPQAVISPDEPPPSSPAIQGGRFRSDPPFTGSLDAVRGEAP